MTEAERVAVNYMHWYVVEDLGVPYEVFKAKKEAAKRIIGPFDVRSNPTGFPQYMAGLYQLACPDEWAACVALVAITRTGANT